MQKLYRLPEVIERVGLSRSTIYEYISRGDFPAPIKIGKRAVAWNEASINQWLNKKGVYNETSL
jgi:prophage regulatory protein